MAHDRNNALDDLFNMLSAHLYELGKKAYKLGRPPLESMGPFYMDGYNETKFLYMDSVP
jgi:hypothetical protein